MDTDMLLPHAPAKRQAAFTLIELAIVIGVLSLLIAGIMSVVSQTTRRAKQVDIQTKLDAIEAELIDFRRLNNRLPCPADATLAITSQYFGVETIAPGACTNTAVYSNGSDLGTDGGTYVAQSANFKYTFNTYYNAYDTADSTYDTATNVTTVGGMVPVKTLGLPDEYAFDPWGGQFFYAVDQRMTAANAFITFPATYAATSANIPGSIIVKDGSGNYRTPTAAPPNTDPTAPLSSAIALIMSFGPDGHGAFQLSGTRKSTGNANANTLINCHCSNAAATTAGNPFTNIFIQAPATSTGPSDPINFDDIVRYYLRSSFVGAYDASPPN